jgi:hypothetical protein
LYSIGKSLIPSTTKGKVLASVAAPIALGAAVSQPSKTLNVVTSAPSELAQFGGDVATFASSPSVKSLKEVFKESPLITTALGIAGVSALGYGASSIIGGALTRSELEKQTEALNRQAVAMESNLGGIATESSLGGIASDQLVKEKPLGSGETAPVAETTTITSGKARSKARRKRNIPQIRQSVRLNILNNAVGQKISNKRYINNEILN